MLNYKIKYIDRNIVNHVNQRGTQTVYQAAFVKLCLFETRKASKFKNISNFINKYYDQWPPIQQRRYGTITKTHLTKSLDYSLISTNSTFTQGQRTVIKLNNRITFKANLRHIVIIFGILVFMGPQDLFMIYSMKKTALSWL